MAWRMISSDSLQLVTSSFSSATVSFEALRSCSNRCKAAESCLLSFFTSKNSCESTTLLRWFNCVRSSCELSFSTSPCSESRSCIRDSILSCSNLRSTATAAAASCAAAISFAASDIPISALARSPSWSSVDERSWFTLLFASSIIVLARFSNSRALLACTLISSLDAARAVFVSSSCLLACATELDRRSFSLRICTISFMALSRSFRVAFLSTSLMFNASLSESSACFASSMSFFILLSSRCMEMNSLLASSRSFSASWSLSCAAMRPPLSVTSCLSAWSRASCAAFLSASARERARSASSRAAFVDFIQVSIRCESCRLADCHSS
mmetsp:Transcript_11765/g.33180  ORF Transcript_11765/g.33180 Transcript_11765/m.33180 type:complete len:327 (-) Transcript_11765:351-1331(-)